MPTDLVYLISLTLVQQVGCVHARTLLETFGSAEAVFRASASELEKLEGIGPARARYITEFRNFSRAEKEVRFLERYHIEALTLTDPRYPRRLLPCYDAPVVLYYKGVADLNPAKIISVIGTRRYSDYGKQVTERLIREIAPYCPIIVSGLAFGIDAIAHKAALKQSLETVGVLAHGLGTIYPPEHTALSKEMIRQGGLLTEFVSDTKPDKHQFPIRNRIVAAISDAAVITETGVKGGSMITADLANGYHKEVFAFPGRVNDAKSAGCNWLIRNHQASLISNANEMASAMGWEQKQLHTANKTNDLLAGLGEAERNVLNLLMERGSMHIDVLQAVAALPQTTMASLLLNLELLNLVICDPGRIYRFNPDAETAGS